MNATEMRKGLMKALIERDVRLLTASTKSKQSLVAWADFMALMRSMAFYAHEIGCAEEDVPGYSEAIVLLGCIVDMREGIGMAFDERDDDNERSHDDYA